MSGRFSPIRAIPTAAKLLGSVPQLGTLAETELPRRFPAFRDGEDDISAPAATDDDIVLAGEADEPDQRAEPILQVENLVTRFSPSAAGFWGARSARCMRFPTFPSICAPVKPWHSWANPAAASRRRDAPSCA